MAHNIRALVFRYLLLAGIATSAVQAQVTNVTDDSSTPIPGAGHDYIGTLSEAVNPANGSLSVRVQVPMPKGRALTLPFAFAYDTNGQHLVFDNGTGQMQWTNNNQYLTKGGWTYSLPTASFVLLQRAGVLNGFTVYCQYYDGYMFNDPSGSRHAMYLSGWANPTICSQLTNAPDNYLTAHDAQVQASIPTPGSVSGYLPVTVADADGTVYAFSSQSLYQVGNPVVALPATVEDRNGNVTSYTGQSNGAFTVKDTASRTAVSGSAFGVNGGTVTVSGLGNYTLSWGTVSGSSYSSGATLVSNDPFHFCSTSWPNVSTGGSEVTSITLPNNKSYTFYYDSSSGYLNKIVYPTGGWVRYTWQRPPLSEIGFTTDSGGNENACAYQYSLPVVVKREVSYDGTTVAEQQDFTYSTTWNLGTNPPSWTSKSTSITTHDYVRGTSTFTTAYTYGSSLLFPPPNTWSRVGTQVPVESTIVYKNWDGTTLRTVNKTWHDPYQLTSEQTILDNGLSSKTVNTYTLYGAQITEKDEYDFGASTPTRITQTSYQAFANTPIYPALPSLFDRPSKVVVCDGAAGTGNCTSSSSYRLAETDYTYDQTATATASVVQHDDTNYPSGYNNRGNLTTKTEKCFVGATACTDSTTTYTYDETGQLLSMTDPCGNSTCSDVTGTNHTTTYSYADNYAAGTGTPPGQTNSYLTQVNNPNTGAAHIESYSWGYTDGQLRSSTDQNGQIASYQYNDSLLRPTQGNYPDGGQTINSYNDSPYSAVNNTPSVTTTQALTSTQNFVSTTAMDGLGHVVRTLLTSDPDGTDITDTAYDGLGRVLTQTNPHRSASSSTDGTTTNYDDALGRICLVVPPDGTAGSTCPATRPTGDVLTTYSGSCTTVTDEAGKTRKSCSDGLGRLTQVFEDPTGLNYETDYVYDALNNLLNVNQKGTAPTDSTKWRTRTFTYNSLSQLLTAANPESGLVTYTYDVNGNLAGKVAPQPNQTGTATETTSYFYDVLNRLTKKSYAGVSTPTVQYGYDAVALTGCTTTPPALTDTYPKGHRTAMCDGSGATSWNHDPMGRALTEKRTIAGITNAISYTYNLDGSLKLLTYPSARVITYTPSAAARTLSAVDTANNVSYITGATYAPPGELAGFSSVKGSSTVSGALTYNKRLQPLQLYYTLGTISSGTLTQLQSAACPTTVATIMSRSYAFGAGTNDNGNVLGITNCRDTNRTQNFLYDSLNRIQQAYTTGTNWGETFSPTATAPGVAPTTSGIDAWGNLTNRSGVTGKTNYEPLSVSATTNNQLTGFTYDAAGNMTQNGSVTYTYDAENRLTTTAGVTYTYDGDGQRVKKSNGTLYWGGTSPDALAETNLSGTLLAEYIFFNGKRVARRDANGDVRYYFSDHLGSHDVVTGPSGAIVRDTDFYPYGGEAYSSGTDSNHYKFTGKERDSESGLDEFGARYYASSLGRFMIPDWSTRPAPVPYAYIGNPQTLNLYSYVQNNPLRFIDPDGHCWGIISWWQHACNAADGLGWRSDKQVEQALTDAHTWLREHGVTAEWQEENLKSDKQVLDVAKAAQNHETSTISDRVLFTIQIVASLPGTLPGSKPEWGRNRLTKELHDRGYVLEGPTKTGDGLIYRNPATGEEMRIMPQPNRVPYRGEPAAKFENESYYRYRPGPGQPEGPHVSIPDK